MRKVELLPTRDYEAGNGPGKLYPPPLRASLIKAVIKEVGAKVLRMPR